MKINFNTIIVFILFMAFQGSFAQKKEENIGTEEVDVVKPYSPTISDAFKIKETPTLDDEGNTQKETIKYTIFSFPVASTFTPSKGKAEGVEKEKQARLYNNYATFAGGNYGILNGELFVTQELNNNDYVGGMLRHLSSQGSIKDEELNDKFYDTSIDLTYGMRQRGFSWNADLGYQNQIYNWYGLPESFGSDLSFIERNDLLAGIDPQQSYNTIYLGSKIEIFDGVVKEASVKFNHFSDAYGSSESRFYVKPTLQFDVDDLTIKTNLILDYLGGSFEKEYSDTSTTALKYGFTNIGIAPSFVLHKDDWTVNFGAGIFYSIDSENNNNKFLIYPQINASYKVVGDLMVFYTGAEGELNQNTYCDFVSQNPFLSPTLAISPTDKKFDLFAGLKGKLVNNVSYNVRASYLNENDKALFKSNDYSEDSTNENYAFGNSMSVVYDDVKTLSFYGELKADINEVITFGINGTFSSYNTGSENEAWNLPGVKISSTLDVAITNQWYTGVNLFYVGERKDQKLDTSIVYTDTPDPIAVAGYFDLNAHLGYKYNDRLTLFLKLNNITGKSYEKWLDYPVQGFQIVLGANYKFDF